jgi:hypothetical protein
LKPKDIKGLVKVGVCPYKWFLHFNRRPDKATCRDCEDFKIGVCEGGIDPIECFKKQKPKVGEIVSFYFKGDKEIPITCNGNCKECPLLASLILGGIAFEI